MKQKYKGGGGSSEAEPPSLEEIQEREERMKVGLEQFLERQQFLDDEDYVHFLSPSPDIQLSGSGEDTVTILINMHGIMRTKRIPEIPTHTVISGSVGLCQIGTRIPLLARIGGLRKLYSLLPISKANIVYSHQEHVNLDYTQRKEVLDKIHYAEPPEGLLEQYEMARKKVNFKRVYKVDREYSIEDDSMAEHMGIYIIESKHPALKTFISTISELQILPGKFSGEYFDTLQKQNIINVDVARIFGGMHDVSGKELPITDDYSGIPHYSGITLSSLLHFFGNLGIRHVNIIEVSCRIYNALPIPRIRRQISEVELENGKKALQQLKDQGSGGSLRKRTVNNNMRTLKRKTRKHYRLKRSKRYHNIYKD
jgi:hypothetical protein